MSNPEYFGKYFGQGELHGLMVALQHQQDLTSKLESYWQTAEVYEGLRADQCTIISVGVDSYDIKVCVLDSGHQEEHNWTQRNLVRIND